MITLLKTKELKSTTNVEGILAQTSEKIWYEITRVMPPKNPWIMRAIPATPAGRSKISEQVYMMRCKTKPDLQEGVDLLIKVLNGEEEAPSDRLL